ncbi:hypothetical protein BC830DRAFT_363109 [Chytriomyces sp. MP71]|nr:hypothetical protein BC830DRAFT_363109 [Chytriomyces sp. MP71]
MLMQRCVYVRRHVLRIAANVTLQHSTMTNTTSNDRCHSPLNLPTPQTPRLRASAQDLAHTPSASQAHDYTLSQSSNQRPCPTPPLHNFPASHSPQPRTRQTPPYIGGPAPDADTRKRATCSPWLLEPARRRSQVHALRHEAAEGCDARSRADHIFRLRRAARGAAYLFCGADERRS